jgi:hypothetical protein
VQKFLGFANSEAEEFLRTIGWREVRTIDIEAEEIKWANSGVIDDAGVIATTRLFEGPQKPETVLLSEILEDNPNLPQLPDKAVNSLIRKLKKYSKPENPLYVVLMRVRAARDAKAAE